MIRFFLTCLRCIACLLVAGFLLSSCSQYSTRPGAITFHNIAAHYNAYFMAEQDLAEAEYEVRKAFKENYNQLLPLLLPMDSVLFRPAKAKLEGAVKKASIVAEKHQNSKWLDNSYLVLGKARLYMGQWPDGLEALRYIYANGRDESDKNNALILLMRAYISHKDFSNALGVAEYLSQQPLGKVATRDFYLTKAFLHQQNGEYLTSVAILEETFPMLKKSEETARIHFAAAQMYDQLGQYALANKHYKAVGRNKAGYDLNFYASMNSLQNEVVLNPDRDLNAVGFDKMLNDRKNDDLKDKIYFTMGLLAEHRKQIPDALMYLQKSAAASKAANPQQKAYTYLQLARINYERLEKFDVSKAYYDSALTLMPETAPEYRLVSDRKMALDEFVSQFEIVAREDSVQKLARMNPAELDNFIDMHIEQQEKQRKAEEERARKEVEAAQAANPQNAPNLLLGPNERRWELYDPALSNQGKIDFKRIWGNRALEDDWRRSKRQMRALASGEQAAMADSTGEGAEPVAKDLVKGTPEWDVIHNRLKEDIPLTAETMAESEARKEAALYALGKIYKFDLQEPQRAIASFERLLKDFPESSYKEELYYLLYLTYAEDNPSKNIYKDKLLSEYANSTYARLVTKPGSSAGPEGAGTQMKEYEAAYALYSQGNYTKALEDIEANFPSYRGWPLEDKFALLRVFLIGKVRGKDAYTQAIAEFISLYPSSQYLPRLKEMQELNSLSMGNR